MRVLHYDTVPELAAQIARLDAAAAPLATARLVAGFPTHTDSSLLTLAPRASFAGLGVRDFATGEWLDVEAAMRDDEAVLFAGDPLAFVSRHHLPACMHRPDGALMAAGAPDTRVSTPFFLYPDAEATLDSGATRPGLRAAGGGSLPELRPPTLSVRHFQMNVGGCRDAWPWKATPYYDGLAICRDSDSFPGDPCAAPAAG